MRYSTVEFKPKAFEPGEWWVTFEDLPYDREPSEGSLSGLGFFHYPRRIGRKAAFEKLKAHMLAKHQEEIDEEMGAAANGQCASLKVVEVPDDAEWEISEYDGNEHIAEKHRTWS